MEPVTTYDDPNSFAAIKERFAGDNVLSDVFTATAVLVDRYVPPGREKALVLTNLENAQLWADKAIERNA